MEVGLGVGVGGVEVGDVGVEEFCEGEVGFADAVDDAAGEFVGAVAVEVGVVADGGGLAGEGVGGVVHEGLDGAFGAHGFEEGLAHGVEVDEGDLLLGGDFAHGVGVAAEGVGDVAGVVEGAAVHGGDEDGCCAFGAGLGDVVDEEFLVVVERDGAGLHVVVGELNEEVVAGLDGGHDLGEALFGDEALGGLAGFGVVGDDDAGEEEAREHLAPGGPGLVVLVDYGGVAGEVDDGLVGDGFDVDGADAGVVAVELEGELVVPVEDAEFAGFEVDFVVGVTVDLGVTDVGVEGAGDGVVGAGGDLFEHEAAAFGADGGDGGLVGRRGRR